MKNELVIIDAGHGGIDSGAVGNGLEEKDLTLEISTYMYNRLKELGVPVVITRDQDEYLPKDKRIDRIKELKRGYQNTLLVSNHINAGGEKGSCSKITFFEKNDVLRLIYQNFCIFKFLLKNMI